MQKLKKGLKLVGLSLLIIIACLGVGISGAAPVLPRNKENSVLEVTVELKENTEEESETMIINHFKQ
ncbi:hypothetical protein [Solitalea canadensis]|uniref:Uncharacterized protein n=1 Tax=Solitalea canadensis (strain ATCC 29591 / DSM 3403 / JCM 21819 / LMG 8368 / NBRC 15130 / NCIMB 12057 / USAM 9D) TaxID=929556 RepID=H8KQ85_SOLCM|nr:hypothetical protein [Solitalea canadensis]AFD06380.1 hypothetical protein Solca_1291 [Solitalea canadensis DSM 3403]